MAEPRRMERRLLQTTTGNSRRSLLPMRLHLSLLPTTPTHPLLLNLCPAPATPTATTSTTACHLSQRMERPHPFLPNSSSSRTSHRHLRLAMEVRLLLLQAARTELLRRRKLEPMAPRHPAFRLPLRCPPTVRPSPRTEERPQPCLRRRSPAPAMAPDLPCRSKGPKAPMACLHRCPCPHRRSSPTIRRRWERMDRRSSMEQPRSNTDSQDNSNNNNRSIIRHSHRASLDGIREAHTHCRRPEAFHLRSSSNNNSSSSSPCPHTVVSTRVLRFLPGLASRTRSTCL